MMLLLLAADEPLRHAAPDLSYTWAQALNDLGQISAIATLIGFMLFAIVAELVLPRSRRAGVVAMVAVTGFAYSLGTAGYRWIYGLGGPAYHGYATGDSFALFFEILFAALGILTVAVSHPYLQTRGLREGEFHILIMAAVIGMMVLASATSLVTVFLGLELFSIALYIACGFIRADSRSQEAAAKYLLVGGFASAFVLYGMALVYGASGTTLIPDIATRLSSSAAGNPLLVLGIVLMGYILVGVIAGGKTGLAAVLFYLFIYLFMNFGAFAIVTLLAGPDADHDRISDLDGLHRRNPLMAILMTVFMLSLAGFPP